MQYQIHLISNQLLLWLTYSGVVPAQPCVLSHDSSVPLQLSLLRVGTGSTSICIFLSSSVCPLNINTFPHHYTNNVKSLRCNRWACLRGLTIFSGFKEDSDPYTLFAGFIVLQTWSSASLGINLKVSKCRMMWLCWRLCLASDGSKSELKMCV